MRHVSYLMMMVATLAVATGCNNPQPQEAAAEGDSNVCQLRKSKEEIVGLETPQGIKLLVGIRDKDQFMSAELIEGYDDTENMWEYICNINKSNEKFICEDYYGFGYTRNKKKKHHHKKSQVSN